MRSFRPFTWLLIGFLLALVSCSSFAATGTVPAEYKDFHPTCGVCSGIFQSEAEAASAAKSQIDAYYGYTTSCSWGKTSGQDGTFYAIYQLSGTTTLNTACDGGSGITATAYCESGTLSGGSCVGATLPDCESGMTYDSASNSCKYDNCVSGRTLDSAMYVDSDGNGLTQKTCNHGCWANYSGSTVPQDVYYGGTQTDSVYIGKYIDTGESCTSGAPLPDEAPDAPPVEDTPEFKCLSQGLSYGNVNGAVVCMPKSSPDATPTNTPDSSTKTNPDGSKEVKTQQDTVNPDGTVTQSTTTTNYDSSGSETGTSTVSTTSGQNLFCASNPTSPICQKSEVTGGGACDVVPVCKGDAIQCAILRQQYEARCETKKQNDFVPEQAVQGEFSSKLSDIDQKKQQLADVMSSIKSEATSLLTFAQSGAGTLGCDAGIPVLGSTFKLCFSNYDSELSPVPTAIIFISLLLALFVMFS